MIACPVVSVASYDARKGAVQPFRAGGQLQSEAERQDGGVCARERESVHRGRESVQEGGAEVLG